ncbi:MAG: type II secretion system F family protein [Candidatus Omnitrophica bacterium]|nr:type II secretion system F family protein [Candidatus Omnitrophota bacterium]
MGILLISAYCLIFTAIVLLAFELSSPFTKREEAYLSEDEQESLDIAALESEKRERNPLRKFLDAFLPVVRPLSKRLKLKGLERKLLMAGYPLNPLEFLSFKFVSTALAGIVVSIIFFNRPLYIAAGLAIGFILPDLWLRSRVQKRQRSISRDLPFVIDLLYLCVGAGLDFMLAVGRVIRDFKKCPLTEELAMMYRETQVGRTRREALKNLSYRVNMVEMSSFTRTLLQADRMGSPMGEALKIQSEEMRIRRFQNGEEMALKAPIKLLFPLLFCILPMVLIMVAGPILLQFMRGGTFGF